MSGPGVAAECHGRKSMAWVRGGAKRRDRLVEEHAGKDQWLI